MMVGALLAALVLTSVAQQPESRMQEPTRGVEEPQGGVGNIEFDEGGWPKIAEPAQRPTVIPQPARQDLRQPITGSAGQADPIHGRQPPPAAPLAEASGRRRDGGAVASGMDLGSPLLEVFQFTRSPMSFKALAGRTVWWRITVYGDEGEILGVRDVTHTLDCSSLERDKLEYELLGKAYGRIGGSRYAVRQGMPWHNDEQLGSHELALFGTHMRMPWCFGDGLTYIVTGTSFVDRPGGRLRVVELERRPLQGTGLIGPGTEQGKRDRFELIYQPGTGEPREFVHHFADGMGSRWVLLEDWREYDGVRLPYRRVYVDEAMRQRTSLTITRIVPEQVTSRTFRLY